jgi:hypothetical protein
MEIPRLGVASPHGGAAFLRSGVEIPHGGMASPRGGVRFPHGGAASPRGGVKIPRSGTASACRVAKIPHEVAPRRDGQFEIGRGAARLAHALNPFRFGSSRLNQNRTTERSVCR